MGAYVDRSELEEFVDEMAKERAVKLAGALEDAFARGDVVMAEILGKPDMLSPEDMAARLGCPRAELESLGAAGAVVALESRDGRRGYPSWQLGAGGKPYRELPRLFALVGEEPWDVYGFLVSTHASLEGLTGLEALRRGRGADALSACEAGMRGEFT